MDRETRRSLIIQATTGTYQDRIEWALDALKAGAGSESLRILASLALEKHPHPQEVDDRFRRSFEELGWKMPHSPRNTCASTPAISAKASFAVTCLLSTGYTRAALVAVNLGYPRSLSRWIGFDDDWNLTEFAT